MYKKTKVYLIGSGIASLASAVYLIEDVKIDGNNIYILEQDKTPGGSLDGSGNAKRGFLIRGGRMHEEKFVCYWDLLSKIPSDFDSSKSIKEDIFDYNEKYVSNAQSRLLKNAKIIDISSFNLSKKDKWDIIKLTLVPEKFLSNKKIQDWFSEDFFKSNFWLLWTTTFAFQKWSSLVEMRRYFKRFMHLFPNLHKLGGIMRTRYNQYDSVITPIKKYLKNKGVHLNFGVQVVDIGFNEITSTKKIATAIKYIKNNKQKVITLDKNDYVFITNGSIVDSSSVGSMTKPPIQKTKKSSGSWALWEKIVQKNSDFGNPGAFSNQIDLQKWVSFTVTLKDPTFFRHMSKTYGYIPGVDGLMTITDSNWLLSLVLAAQPHFISQPEEVEVFWGYGLYPDKIGNFIKKKMSECTGEEILTELFRHLKINNKMKSVIKEKKINCLPVMMPFIDSAFMPRKMGDRPKVVPKGAANFAFLGQFTEIPKDCVFTVEYSVRSAQIAVYSHFKIKKEVLPVYVGGIHISPLLNALKTIIRK
ncbi:oleate hydratase [Pseudomonadota bacterium]